MSVRYVYLVADVGRGRMLSGDYFPLKTTDLIAYPGDEMDFRIYFRVEKSAGDWEPFPIGEHDVMELTVKKDGQYESGDVLVYSPQAQWNIAGDWKDLHLSEGHCSVRVNFNTTKLRDALNSDDASITVRCDITVQSPGRRPSTVQFAFTVANDVRRGNEGEPEDIHPEYATVDYLLAKFREVTHPANGRYRIENGTLYLRDRTTGAYEPYELDDGKLVRIQL